MKLLKFINLHGARLNTHQSDFYHPKLNLNRKHNLDHNQNMGTVIKLMSAFVLTSLITACGNTETESTTTSNNTVSQTSTSGGSRMQEWSDATRLKDLAYWSGLFEEYKDKKGFYPLQDKAKNDIILVKIATPEQRALLTGQYDNNANGMFKEASVDALIAELSDGLGRSIEPRYDPVPSPEGSPVGYYYFTEHDGYILWTPCKLCEISKISTYLMDGHTVTLNIASDVMVGKIPKAQTREDMLNNSTYQKWVSDFEKMPAEE